MDNREQKIIMISQLLADKADKEKELQYYQSALNELLAKMGMIKKEIDLTNTIIDIIKDERADKIQEVIEEREEERILKFE